MIDIQDLNKVLEDWVQELLQVRADWREQLIDIFLGLIVGYLLFWVMI